MINFILTHPFISSAILLHIVIALLTTFLCFKNENNPYKVGSGKWWIFMSLCLLLPELIWLYALILVIQELAEEKKHLNHIKAVEEKMKSQDKSYLSRGKTGYTKKLKQKNRQ